MAHTTVIAHNAHIEFDVEAEYVGKKLEITYVAVDENKSPAEKKTMADFLGILSDKSAKELLAHVKKTRNEWDRGI